MLVTLCVTSVAHTEGLFPAGQDVYRQGSLSPTHSVSHSPSLFHPFTLILKDRLWLRSGRGQHSVGVIIHSFAD